MILPVVAFDRCREIREHLDESVFRDDEIRDLGGNSDDQFLGIG